MIRSFEIQCKSWPSASLSASRAAHCRSYNVFQSNWAYLFRYRKWKKQTNNAVLCNGTLSLLRHCNVSLPRTIFPRSRKAHMSPSFFPTLLPLAGRNPARKLHPSPADNSQADGQPWLFTTPLFKCPNASHLAGPRLQNTPG